MQHLSDFHLLTQAAAGSAQDFREFYERHVEAVYDFAWRTLRSLQSARESVEETFTEARESAGLVLRPAEVRSWLFNLAYHAVMARAGRPHVRGETPPSPPDLLVDSDVPGADDEMAALVWQAASGLEARHYAVLDLDVRQELEPGEIAPIIGVTRQQAATMLSRLEEVVEHAITAFVMARRGPRACEHLRTLLGGSSIPPFPPDLRQLVDSHVEACRTCSATRDAMPSPLEILGDLAPVRTPDEARREIIALIAGTPVAETEEEEPQEAPAAGAPPDAEGVEAGAEAPSEEAEAVEEAEAQTPPAVEEAAGVEEALDAFPPEGIDEEPEALVRRGETVGLVEVPVEPPQPVEAGEGQTPGEEEEVGVAASETVEAPPDAGPQPPIPVEAGAEAAPEAAPEAAVPPPWDWRAWIRRPWVSFAVGAGGGLIIVGIALAVVYGGGGGGEAVPTETPTATSTSTSRPELTEEQPSPTAEPSPTEETVIPPVATMPPTLEPTATPEAPPAPTDTPEPPAPSPTAVAETATPEAASTPVATSEAVPTGTAGP